MYRVYLITNATGRRYIGLSEDVAHRLEQHNRGESRWTAKYGPWKLDWMSGPLTLSDARKLENRLKRQKGGEGLSRLLAEHGGS
jgi:putative endonuclease